jgi:hypothetical protein
MLKIKVWTHSHLGKADLPITEKPPNTYQRIHGLNFLQETKIGIAAEGQ